jgi:hypothetical protein
MIRKPLFQKFRIGELVQFLYDVLGICDKNKPEVLLITAQVTSTRTSAKELDNNFKLDQGSSLSSVLVTEDQRRDRALIGIHSCIEGYTYHFDTTIREAAILLLASIEKYGSNIQQQNYQAETSSVNSILESWTTDSKLAAALVTLKMVDWAAELKTANTLFNGTYLLRVEEKGEAPSADTFELRKAAIARYRELVNEISAQTTIVKNTTYDKVTNELNVLIHSYNMLVANRGSDDKTKNTGTTTTTPAK